MTSKRHVLEDDARGAGSGREHALQRAMRAATERTLEVGEDHDEHAVLRRLRELAFDRGGCRRVATGEAERGERGQRDERAPHASLRATSTGPDVGASRRAPSS